MLAEAAFVAVSTPGPMRAFYGASARAAGSQIAIVAVARKLAVLFWHLLTREQDYAFQRPSLTRKKLRATRTAGRRRAPPRPTRSPDQEHIQPARRTNARARALRTAIADRRPVTDWRHQKRPLPPHRRDLTFRPPQSSTTTSSTPRAPDGARRQNRTAAPPTMGDTRYAAPAGVTRQPRLKGAVDEHGLRCERRAVGAPRQFLDRNSSDRERRRSIGLHPCRLRKGGVHQRLVGSGMKRRGGGRRRQAS